MNTRILTFIALGFGALVLLQAVMGAWLFYLNIGVTPSAINLYYAPKTFHGLMEVILPHTFSIAVALMVLLHFLAFIETISMKQKQYLMHSLFLLFGLDQLSPVMISFGFELFAYLKMVSFAGFEMILAWGWIVMFREVVSDDFSHH